MFRDLKFFLLVWKVVGLQPIQNISRSDHTRWRADILDVQTFLMVGVKAFYMVAHLYSRLHKNQLVTYEFILAAISVAFDFTQFICSRKLIESLSKLAASFDNRRELTKPLERARCKYLWTAIMIAFIIAYISVYQIISREKVSLDLLRRYFVYIPLYFARFSVPLSYAFLCTELTYRFGALRHSCRLLGREMIAGGKIFLVRRPWRQYGSRILCAREAYSFLCDLTEDFRRSFDVPITFFLFVMVTEAWWYCYLLTGVRNTYYDYRLVRFFLNSVMLCTFTYRMDALTEAVIGLQPIQNILQNDRTRWKVDILNWQTFFMIGLKAFYMFLHVQLLLKKEPVMSFELVLAAVSVAFDLTQFTCSRKLLEILSQLVSFDSGGEHSKSSGRPARRKYLWTITIVAFITGYISLYHVISQESPMSLDLLRRWTIYVPLYFARFSVPLSYAFLCTELSYRFVALRESCTFLGCEMSAAENIFIVRSSWACYDVRILSASTAYAFLCDQTENLRRSFDVPIALFLFVMVCESCWYCYLLTAVRDHSHYYRLVRFCSNTILMCVLMERMDNLTETSFDLVRIIRKWPFRYFPTEIQEQLEGFLIQIEHNPLATRFSDFGYVSVSRKLILPLTTCFVTYVIILAQISPKLKKYFEQSN